jgi:hypothetical protein
VTFQKNRWRIGGGGFFQSYMRIFGQESLGRPDIEIESDVDSLTKHLLKHMDESELPPINAVMVFTSDAVDLDVEETPVPAIKLKQLKEFIRQRAKEKKLTAETMHKIQSALE